MSLKYAITRHRFLLCVNLLVFAGFIYANQSSLANSNVKNGYQATLSRMSPGILWGDTHFNFDALQPTLQSNVHHHFQGHTRLYGIGGDRVPITSTLYSGLYIYHTDTVVTASMTGVPDQARQQWKTINNTTLYGHITQQLNPSIDVDLAGGYGRNNATNHFLFPLNPPFSAYAKASNRMTNWFWSATGLYKKSVGHFLLRLNLGLLYSDIASDRYTYFFNAFETPKQVPAFANHVFFVVSGVELAYKATNHITPFINAGALSSMYSSNRYADAFMVSNPVFPQLNVDASGFSVGGGISLKWRSWVLRIGERAYYAGDTYASYQTLIGLKYDMG